MENESRDGVNGSERREAPPINPFKSYNLGNIEEVSVLLQAVLQETIQVTGYLENLQKKFVQKIEKDAGQKEAFDKLYEEMRQYKDNFLFEAIRPVIMDLILLYDNIVRASKNFKDIQMRETISSFQEELLEILYRQDVSPMGDRTKESPLSQNLAEVNNESPLSQNSAEANKIYQKFNRKFQKAIKIELTDNPEEDGIVTEVVREGFVRGDRILRPQEVVCKKCRTQK